MLFDITEDDINLWAEKKREAESTLPDLVRRLVCSIAGPDEITNIHFPAYKATTMGGYDGLLVTREPSLFSNSLSSAWEISVRKDATNKANIDYAKRTKEIPAKDRMEMTYVCLTAKSWPAKTKWVSKKQALNEWKEIRAYDASDIATWLTMSLSVSTWFSQKLDKLYSGLCNINTYLNRWAERTIPFLPIDMILAGRDAEVKTVTDWLAGPPSVFQIRAETIEESVLFVCAVLLQQDSSARQDVGANGIVIRNPLVWDELQPYLNETQIHIVLIPAYSGFDSPMSIITAKHHLVIPYETGQTWKPQSVHVNLKPIDRDHLSKALMPVVSGNEDKAKKLANDSGGKLSAIQRALGFTRKIPAWVDRYKNDEILIGLLFTGHWDTSSEGDIAVLTKLTNGHGFDKIAKRINELLNIPDPPLRIQGRTQKWRSMSDAWTLLVSNITKPDLDRFEQACISVLRKASPRYDMPINERYMADIYKKILPESNYLRTGLADNLAWLYLNKDEIERNVGVGTVLGIIAHVLREVLNGDWKVWASIASGLRSMAEACPRIFLEQLSQAINDPAKEFHMLFAQDSKESSIFSECCHAELLWALEVLAWHPDFFAQVVDVLMALCQIDKGGTYSNRPSATLFSLFDPFMLQTSASIDDRVVVLTRLCKKYPAEGWHLVKHIMQRSVHGGIGTSNARPEFQEWNIPPSFTSPSGEDYQKYIKACYGSFLSCLEADPIKCIEVLLDRIFPRGIQDILSIVRRNKTSFKNLESRLHLQKALRQYIHFAYLTNQHLNQEVQLTEILRLAEEFSSGVNEEDNVWLFTDRPELPEPYQHDYQKEAARVQELRTKAIEDILHSDNPLPKLLLLADRAVAPRIVGYTLGLLPGAVVFETEIWNLMLRNAYDKFVNGYIYGSYHKNGIDWLKQKADALIQHGLFDKTAQMLAAIESTVEIRDYVDTHPEIQAQYWKMAYILCTTVRDAQDFSRIVNNLLSVGRWTIVIDFAAMARHSHSPASVEDYLNILRYGLSLPENQDIQYLDQWHLCEVFKAIDDVPSIGCSEEELVRLEVYYLCFLEHSDRSMKYISKLLRNNPEFFVNIICQTYMKYHEPREQRSTDEQTAKKAQTAYLILSCWKDYPGVDKPSFTERDLILYGWCARVIQLLKAEDREKVGLQKTGEVLARVPPSEKDGIWPCDVARKFIEEGYDELTRGLQIAKHNSRGVTCRGLTEGGNQERILAKQYRKDAGILKNEYPKTAALLSTFAEEYENEGRSHDQESERFVDP